jgi:hypothetical protein
MMTPLLKKRPELAGRFHRAFEHNSDTGVFIPAKHVAEAADTVRGQLFDKEVAERERYWGLYWVLRAAARNGLAYWEATDLGVANTRPEMIAPPPASFEWLGEGANRSLAVVDGTVFLSREADTQSFAIDARVAPTEPRPCPAGFGARASRLASGEWAACSKGELRIFDARDGIPHELARAIEVPISTTIGDSVIVRACGDGAVLLPFSYSGRLDQSAYWFDGEVVRAIEGLPAPKLGSRHGTNWYAIAATTLGSDNAVILWNGEGYEIDNGSVVGAPWRLDLQIKDAVQSITAWGQDGFYFGDDQTLRRVRRGAPPETVAKLPDKIRELAPGPDGSVLVVHSLHPTKHKQERSVTLVFPERGEEIAVNRYDVQLASLRYTGGFFWGAARKVRTDSSSDHAFRLPESVILSMPPSPLKVPKR